MATSAAASTWLAACVTGGVWLFSASARAAESFPSCPSAACGGRGRASIARALGGRHEQDARKVFQEETGRALTVEDARQMLENLTGFFMVLHEWDRAQTKRDADSASRKDGPNSRIDEN